MFLEELDLRQRNFEILAQAINPTEDEKTTLRQKRGLVFLPMASQSYAQIVAQSEHYFWKDQLKFANSHPELRDYIPPVAVEIGLIEDGLALPDSVVERAIQLRMIEEYSQELQKQFPQFRAIMLPATGYASADLEYSMRTGQPLFRTHFARCLDGSALVKATFAGRGGPSSRFSVQEWDADSDGYLNHIWAVPAVVKVGSHELSAFFF